MCLAEFASKYKKSSQKPNDDKSQKEKQIRLLKGLGTMQQRTQAIIRYHQWSVRKQPSQYYHAQLLLYYPWRNELTDLPSDSYEETYESHKQTVEQNRQFFEYHTNEIDLALDNIEQFGPPDETWNILAPQVQQMQDEDRSEGITEVPSINSTFHHCTSTSVDRDVGLVPHEVEFSNEKMSQSD